MNTTKNRRARTQHCKSGHKIKTFIDLFYPLACVIMLLSNFVELDVFLRFYSLCYLLSTIFMRVIFMQLVVISLRAGFSPQIKNIPLSLMGG